MSFSEQRVILYRMATAHWISGAIAILMGAGLAFTGVTILLPIGLMLAGLWLIVVGMGLLSQAQWAWFVAYGHNLILVRALPAGRRFRNRLVSTFQQTRWACA